MRKKNILLNIKEKKTMKNLLTPIKNENGAVTVLEIIMILVILVAVLAIFQGQLTTLVTNLFADIFAFNTTV